MGHFGHIGHIGQGWTEVRSPLTHPVLTAISAMTRSSRGDPTSDRCRPVATCVVNGDMRQE